MKVEEDTSGYDFALCLEAWFPESDLVTCILQSPELDTFFIEEKHKIYSVRDGCCASYLRDVGGQGQHHLRHSRQLQIVS